MRQKVQKAVVTLDVGTTIEVFTTPVRGSDGVVPLTGASINGAAQTVTVQPVTR